MHSGRLVLQAPHPGRATDSVRLQLQLMEIGLLGEHYPGAADAWLVGPRFLQLIAFLGCSPHLQLEPPADGGSDFCHLRLRGPYPEPRLLSAGNTRPPRCPGCGTALRNWRQLETPWSIGRTGHAVDCSTCKKASLPADLNWRRSAGWGTEFIEIFGIYPEEAIPQPALMEALRADNAEWRHFYLMD